MIKPRLYGAIGYKPYFDYTYLALDYFLRSYNKQKFTPLNYYEFGTGKGGECNSIFEVFKGIIESQFI